MNFKEWLIEDNKVRKSTAKHYAGAIYGRLTLMARQAGLSSCLYQVRDVRHLKEVIGQFKAMPDFIRLNQDGHRMYSSALSKFTAYLLAMGYEDSLEKDVQALLQKPAGTERERWIKTRLGQGDYRKHLMALWGGQCSVSGYTAPDFLIASHIKPWRSSSDEERLDPANGLLLIPNLDRAFDQGYISFDARGQILISDVLSSPATLGIYPSLKLRQVLPEQRLYLEYHRDVLYLDQVRD